MDSIMGYMAYEQVLVMASEPVSLIAVLSYAKAASSALLYMPSHTLFFWKTESLISVPHLLPCRRTLMYFFTYICVRLDLHLIRHSDHRFFESEAISLRSLVFPLLSSKSSSLELDVIIVGASFTEENRRRKRYATGRFVSRQWVRRKNKDNFFGRNLL